MKTVKILIAGALAAMAVMGAAAATDNVVEEVAWVVGDQPIWKSEIEETYQQMLYEKIPIDGDPYCAIPETLAVEKLYLHQAEVDTVEIQSSMVIQRVESMLNNYVASLGSKEKVEEYFNKPISKLREDMTTMLTNRSKIDMVQENLTKDVKATPADVRRFYSTLSQDSVPNVPMQVEVQILTLTPAIPRQEIEDIKTRLRDFSERVNSGQSDFSTLARLYSEDGSALRGGELGFMGRGQLVPEYAAVAFNLNDPKRVSKIVETEYGFHIIQLIEKRGDRINTRHILLKPKVSDSDLIESMHRLDSLRSTILLPKKATFEEAVALLSSDKDTHNNRGVLVNPETGNTRFEMSQLPQEIAKAVAGLQPGEISEAFIMKNQKNSRDQVAIVKLTNRIDAHRANVADDYQLIKNMYEMSEKSKILKKWLADKINQTYVRIEDGWRNCDFKNPGWLKAKE